MLAYPYGPLTSMGYDPFRTHIVSKKIIFAWLPKKCHVTRKFIWLKYAYQEVAMWTGPGEPFFAERWYDKDTYLIEKLKGNL